MPGEQRAQAAHSLCQPIHCSCSNRGVGTRAGGSAPKSSCFSFPHGARGDSQPASTGQAPSHAALRVLFPDIPFWSQAARAAAPALGHRALVVKAVPCPGSLFFTAKKKAVTRSGRALLLFFPHCFKENDKFTELRVPVQGGSAQFRTEGCFQGVSGNLFNLFFQK